jgi:hypothetical protein
MSTRLALAALITLIGLTGSVWAQSSEVSHAAGPVYGGPGSVGGTVTCRIFNFGGALVTITARRIFNNVNEVVQLASDTCNVPLGLFKSCAFSAPITGNFAFSCQVDTQSGTLTPHISGVAEIQAPNHAVLSTVPLQSAR